MNSVGSRTNSAGTSPGPSLPSPWQLYDALIDLLPDGVTVTRALLGRVALVENSAGGVGTASNDRGGRRERAASRNIIGRPLRDVAALVKSWDFELASLGVAALNSWLNSSDHLAALDGNTVLEGNKALDGNQVLANLTPPTPNPAPPTPNPTTPNLTPPTPNPAPPTPNPPTPNPAPATRPTPNPATPNPAPATRPTPNPTPPTPSLLVTIEQTDANIFDTNPEAFAGSKVALIGHFSQGIKALSPFADLTVIERDPRTSDLPDTACEYVLPEMDAVFITGMTVANKTLPRLLDLAAHARVYLVGPSVPCAPEVFGNWVQHIATSRVTDVDLAFELASIGARTPEMRPATVRFRVDIH